MKQLLTCLLAVTIYLTNGEVRTIEKHCVLHGDYVQYTEDNTVHIVPYAAIREITYPCFKLFGEEQQ